MPHERVIRLPGLDAPPRHARVTAAELEHYSAVQLLLSRSYEGLDRSSLKETHAVAVSRMSAELEGIPLAIEFAAALIRNLGFSNAPVVATEDFLHFDAGLRHRPVHHRSLAVSLNWSLNLLSDPERLVLSRLSRLTGSFNLDTAITAAVDAAMSRTEAIACISALVSKSLSEKADSSFATFRLLHCIRMYARKRQANPDDRQDSCRDSIEISRRLLSIDGYRTQPLADAS